MALKVEDVAVLSGADQEILIADYPSLDKSELHRISVDGAGTATITADFGRGYQATGGTLTDDYDTFLLPGVKGIKVAAAGGDITFSLLSYNNSDIVE